MCKIICLSNIIVKKVNEWQIIFEERASTLIRYEH